MAARIQIRTSKWALRAYRIGVFAVPILIIGVLGSRFDYFGELETFAVIGAGFFCAFVAVLCALAGISDFWRDDDRGLGRALAGLVLGFAGFAPALLMGAAVLIYPRITDVSSDIIEPPMITVRDPGDEERIARGASGGLVVEDLFGLPLEETIEDVFGLAMPLIEARGWTVIRSQEPAPERLTALVEVVARTPVLGFRDRATIRLTRFPGGTLVDMRSITLRGRHDFGLNLRRISAFFEDIVTTLEARETGLDPEGGDASG